MGVGVLVAGVLSGPAPALAAVDGWGQAGYGAADTYYNPDESELHSGSIDAIAREWVAPLGTAEARCARAGTPVVAGGRVFVPEETGVAGFGAETGELSWRYFFDFPEDESTAQLAATGGLLIVANHGCQSQSDPNGTVRALSAVTGRQMWDVDIDAPVVSMVVDRGVVVVSGASASDLPKVIGLRAENGRQRWSSDNYQSSGVSAAGRLLVSRADGVGTAALSVRTGEVLWSNQLEWTARAADPVGNHVYVTDAAGALLAVDAATGAVVWTAAGKASALIAADGRRVYRAAGNGVEALAAGTGRRKWAAELGGVTGQPVRAGGLLYTTVGGQALGILTASNGRRVSSGVQFGVFAGGNVVVTGGWLYGTRDDTTVGYAPDEVVSGAGRR